MSPGADVVVVPDFRGAGANVFTVRTLYFLASWLEYAGRARAFPLHLACIGEPPPAVRNLAANANARIHVYPPLAEEGVGFVNKLRGLEVTLETGRLLLLDSDVLVLNDLSGLAGLDADLGMAPALVNRVSLESWTLLYAAAGMPLPRERMPCLSAALGLRLPRQRRRFPEDEEGAVMLPYYNAGVVLASERSGLKDRWPHYLNLCGSLPSLQRNKKAVRQSDQSSLALVIQEGRQRGLRFVELPPAGHSHHLYLYRRKCLLDQTVLFHALGFGRGGKPGRKDAGAVGRGYRSTLRRQLWTDWWLERNASARARAWFGCLWPALRDADRLAARLEHLHRKYIQPLDQAGGS